MKTSELTGMALDWAVAKCLGYVHADGNVYLNCWAPSTDWSQGGPIIEREAISVSEGSPIIGIEWMACDRSSSHIQHGLSYLIAAMRCYCYSKLGDEIDIPEELQPCQQPNL